MHEPFQSVRCDTSRCQGHRACMRVCPTEAIRVRNNIAQLHRERCIDCGECVRVCPNRAFVAQTSSFSDFSRFKYTVAIPSPVFYSQFGKDVSPAMLLAALKRVGFDDSYDDAESSESVSIAIQEHLDTTESPRPFISPFCPVIVRLIQLRYPNLLDHLIPIESPMEIAAREVKRARMRELNLKESEIGVIYITPCPAKMVAIKQPPRKRHSFINGAIAISEIYPSVHHALAEVAGRSDLPEIRSLGLGWPILGGQLACLHAEDCLAIGGLNDAVRIFEEIEDGKLRDIQYIEVHSCPTGCVGGSLNVENAYIARGRVLRQVRSLGGKPIQNREQIRGLHRRDFFSLPGKIPSLALRPPEGDVSKGLEKLRRRKHLYDLLPKIDCGACGSPTCMAFAEDVVEHSATTDECVFMGPGGRASRTPVRQKTRDGHRHVPDRYGDAHDSA